MAATGEMSEPDDHVTRMLEVAVVGKPHGLRGEVYVRPISNIPERFAVGAVFSSDRGGLEIASVRWHGDRMLIRFAGSADRSDAEALRGTVLKAAASSDEDPDDLWSHQLIGAAVIDQNGRERGVVRSIIDNPAHDILELADRTLVPTVFITSVDPAARHIHVTVPDGIFEGDA